MNPLVSVVIVNRNGAKFLPCCLFSIFFHEQGYPNLEIIVVDNNSSDGSFESMKQKWGKYATFLQTGGDYGPAVARNFGAKNATGKYILFLDNDTTIDDDETIAQLVNYMEYSYKVGLVGAKLLNMEDETLDSSGDNINAFGFLSQNSYHVQPGPEVLSVKTAGCMIRKDVFDMIEGFDESYYMYLEDTDLAWRVRLLGYSVVFDPTVVIYHAFNTPEKKGCYDLRNVRYNGCRNYITTLIKNLDRRNLFTILPRHIACWLFMAMLFIARGKVIDGIYILQGIWYNIRNFRTILRKRRHTQGVEKYFITREPLRSYIRKIISYLGYEKKAKV